MTDIAGYSYAWMNMPMDRKTMVDSPFKHKWIYSQKIFKTRLDAEKASKMWLQECIDTGQNLAIVILEIPYEEELPLVKKEFVPAYPGPRNSPPMSADDELREAVKTAEINDHKTVTGPYGEIWENEGTSIRPFWIRKTSRNLPVACDENGWIRTMIRSSKKTDNKHVVFEMRLCEASRIFLKPNTLYKFTVDKTCEACKKAERLARGEKE